MRQRRTNRKNIRLGDRVSSRLETPKMNDMEQWKKCWKIRCPAVKILTLLKNDYISRIFKARGINRSKMLKKPNKPKSNSLNKIMSSMTLPTTFSDKNKSQKPNQILMTNIQRSSLNRLNKINSEYYHKKSKAICPLSNNLTPQLKTKMIKYKRIRKVMRIRLVNRPSIKLLMIQKTL